MCASVSVCVGELNPRRSIIYLFVYEHEIVIRLSLIWLFHLEIFDWIVCSTNCVHNTCSRIAHTLNANRVHVHTGTHARTHWNLYIDATAGDIFRRITNIFLGPTFSSSTLSTPIHHSIIYAMHRIKAHYRMVFVFACMEIELGNHCFSNYRFYFDAFFHHIASSCCWLWADLFYGYFINLPTLTTKQNKSRRAHTAS